MALTLVVLAPTTTAVIYAPTLYRMFCAVTGYGGTVQRAERPLNPAKTAAGKADRKITVYFDSNVAPGLPWDFRPEQRSVDVTPGSPKKVYYYARNRSDKPVVARATFNVLPYVAAPYFFKIECFCFTEERLGPGERARMPLVFYIDEEMMKDPDASRFDRVDLSYTFFRQEDLSAEEARAARDLAAGSVALDRKLEQKDSAAFANDAPKRR